MSTTSTSGLSSNNDFAAELILNRLQNGTLKSNSGNTITGAGRTNASTLDINARVLGNQAGEVAKGLTYAQGVQNTLSELLDQTKKIGDSIADGTLDKTGVAFKSNIDAILKETVDGQKTVGGSITVSLDGTNDLTVQSQLSTDADWTSFTGKIKDGSAVQDDYEKAVAALNNAISAAGAQYSIISNRYDSINDLIGTYKTASNDQAVVAGGSASSLLDSLL